MSTTAAVLLSGSQQAGYPRLESPGRQQPRSRIVRLDSIAGTALHRDRALERGRWEMSIARCSLLANVHLLRAPLFVPPRVASACEHRAATVHLEGLQPVGGGEAPTVRDALLLGEIAKRYHGLGCPQERTVYLTGGQTARAMGYRSAGGRQRRQARRGLERLLASRLLWRSRCGDELCELSFALLDSVSGPAEPAGGSGLSAVRLSAIGAELFGIGYVHYINREIAQRLIAADQRATRLWLALECERFRPCQAFHYRIFRTPRPAGPQRSGEIFIAELLGLDGWANRREVAARLKRAIATIMELDPGRYRLAVRHGKLPATYNLVVERFARPAHHRGAVESAAAP